MTIDSKRSVTLYMVKRDREHAIVTDIGHVVASVDASTPIMEAHALCESITRCMVKLVTPTQTVVRATGIVMTRGTDDHDDPILDRLIRMIRG